MEGFILRITVKSGKRKESEINSFEMVRRIQTIHGLRWWIFRRKRYDGRYIEVAGQMRPPCSQCIVWKDVITDNFTMLPRDPRCQLQLPQEEVINAGLPATRDPAFVTTKDNKNQRYENLIN